jgi:hypothetical protein
MKKLGKREWFLILALVLVVSTTGLFAVRTVRRAVYWRYHQDEPIRPWMSVGYIAHSYRVPPWVLTQSLGLPPGPDRRPLREIARDQGRSVDEVIAVLQNAIIHSRPPYPPPVRTSVPPPGGDKGQSDRPNVRRREGLPDLPPPAPTQGQAP